MVLPYINMYLPQVYTCSPLWTPVPPASPNHPSGSSQCTSPKHPVSCIEPGLATRFIYDIIHVSMPFSQIIPPSSSPSESKRLFYTSVSLFQTTRPASWEICMQVKNQQLEPDMEQRTGSKLGKEYIKATYCHPAYLTYIQSTSCKMLGWMKLKLESRLPEETSKPQICRWHHPYGRKWRGTKEPLDEGQREEWKSWLKTQHSKN